MTNKLPNRTSLLVTLLGAITLIAGTLNAQEDSDSPTEEKAQNSPETPAENKDEAEEKETSIPEARETLDKAIEALNSYDSLRAELTETVAMGSQRFVSEGRYMQARGDKVRLSFELSIKGADGKPLKGSLLQISNGDVLFTSHQIGEQLQVTNRDLKKILEAMEKFPSMDAEMMKTRLGLGGLPALLSGLQDSFTFDVYRQDTLSNEPVLLIAGNWKKSLIEQMTKVEGGEDRPFPASVPDRVYIYFLESTLIPRRVVYLKKTGDSYQRMLTLDFLKVETNVPVSADDFTFYPPEGAVSQDITDAIIQQIQQMSQPQQTSPLLNIPQQPESEPDQE